MYYPCSENKGADQLRGYREADLRLCFRLGENPVFSRCGSFMILQLHRKLKELTNAFLKGQIFAFCSQNSGGNWRTLGKQSDHYPATCPDPDLNPDRRGDKHVCSAGLLDFRNKGQNQKYFILGVICLSEHTIHKNKMYPCPSFSQLGKKMKKKKKKKIKVMENSENFTFLRLNLLEPC